MFKDLPEGQTHYCEACEVENHKGILIGENFRHTCGKTNQANNEIEFKNFKEFKSGLKKAIPNIHMPNKTNQCNACELKEACPPNIYHTCGKTNQAVKTGWVRIDKRVFDETEYLFNQLEPFLNVNDYLSVRQIIYKCIKTILSQTIKQEKEKAVRDVIEKIINNTESSNPGFVLVSYEFLDKLKS